MADPTVVKRSPAEVARTQKMMQEQALRDDLAEAAQFTEETVAWLNAQWADRAFSPEQAVFSIALTCCNLRDHFPPGQGGTEFFDRIAAAARDYFDKNKNA